MADNDKIEVTGSLTKDEWERSLDSERDYVRGQIATVIARIEVEHEKCKGQYYVAVQRFDDMDRATQLLSATVNRVPTDLQTAIGEVLRLMDERDARVEARFDANEKLSKTESELNQTALAAALQAAKEASAVQGVATDRTIDKNAELAAVTAAALAARVTQLTEQFISLNSQVTSIMAGKAAVVEQKTDTRSGNANVYGIVGSIVGILAFVLAMALAVTRLYAP